MIVASICMRSGSKGVVGKNNKNLLGKPLLYYTIECAMKSEYLDEIVISSDSQTLLDLSKKYISQKNIFKRKKSLATDLASKWDVFKNLVLEFEELNKKKISYLVDLDVTVPRRLPVHIDDCIRLSKKTDADVVITGYEPERNPYFNMMELQDDGIATIVKKPSKAIVCRQDAPKVYSLTPAVYVIKREALFKHDHWSYATCRIHPIPRNLSIDIDTELDFKLVEFLMKNDEK